MIITITSARTETLIIWFFIYRKIMYKKYLKTLSGEILEGAVSTYTAGGAMQFFISGDRMDKSEMSYES